ncbi:MAG: LysE family translocator [Microcella sp.]
MDLALYVSFSAAISLLWFLPGPDWAFVITQAQAKQPWQAGIVGIALGYVVMTAVLAGGIGVLIAATPLALPVITVAGASYLIALGTLAVRRMLAGRRASVQGLATLDPVGAHPMTGPLALPAAVDGAETVAPAVVGERRSAVASVAAGFAVSALNPKAFIFFVALFPQFVSAAAPWPLPAQLAVLGATWIAVSSVLYAALAFTSRRVFARVPRAAAVIAAIAASSMVIMGVVLIAEQLVPLVTG